MKKKRTFSENGRDKGITQGGVMGQTKLVHAGQVGRSISHVGQPRRQDWNFFQGALRLARSCCCPVPGVVGCGRDGQCGRHHSHATSMFAPDGRRSHHVVHGM